MSKEEELMSERKRCVAWGITDFECHPPSGKFVFPAGGSLFGVVDHGSSASNNGSSAVASVAASSSSSSSHQAAAALSPFELKTRCRLARLNATLCPANPDLVAFVGEFDLWLTHLASGQELRLTHSHKGAESLADDPLSAGMPSYVMQEEFNRFTGVWWRPVAESTAGTFFLKGFFFRYNYFLYVFLLSVM